MLRYSLESNYLRSATAGKLNFYPYYKQYIKQKSMLLDNDNGTKIKDLHCSYVNYNYRYALLRGISKRLFKGV